MSSNDSKRINQGAAPEPGETPGGGQSLSRRSGNGKGSVTFPAQADTRIGGPVLDENSGLYRSGKGCHMFHMIRMHHRGMTVSLLNLDPEFNSVIHIPHLDNG